MPSIDDISFEEFKEEWIREIEALPNTKRKGTEFAVKIARQYCEVDPDDYNFHPNDGPGDGGIDIAYLEEGGDPAADADGAPNTWYVFQCKYGTAGRGATTIKEEGEKFLKSMSVDSQSPAQNETVEMLRTFCHPNEQSEEPRTDRLVYVFATVEPLDDDQRNQLDKIRELGTRQFSGPNSPIFDVDAVSLETLFEKPKLPPFELKGQFHRAHDEQSTMMWIGTVTVYDLYDFLNRYQSATQELDRIYEKNVRSYLGAKTQTSVNKGLLKTVSENPQKLGVFNNGVTFVASGINSDASSPIHVLRMESPYIVNGCQTTRTIYDYVRKYLGAGLPKDHADVKSVTAKMKASVLVVKVIRPESEDEIGEITRFSNTQNAVYERDFVALEDQFQEWKQDVEMKHGRFLEIQRGSWEARVALEKKRPNVTPRFTDIANAEPIKANEMIKIFGAGWLGLAGTASRNAEAFRAPSGSAFKEISALSEVGEFGADSFVAAFHLQSWAKDLRFGPRNSWPRNVAKNHFYYVLVELLRSIIGDDGERPAHRQVTDAILRLEASSDGQTPSLATTAAKVIDRYFGKEGEGPYTQDEAYKEAKSARDLIQGPLLDGKDDNWKSKANNLWQAFQATILGMSERFEEEPSIRDKYREALGLEFE